MFDANMRHLPKGKRFFAKICGLKEGHPVRYIGINSNLVLCEMLSDEHENPTVRFYGSKCNVDVSDSESGIGSWLAYEGNEDLTGFICNESKAMAEGILNSNKRKQQ